MIPFHEIVKLPKLVFNDENGSFISHNGEDNRIYIEYHFNKQNKHLYAKVRFGKSAQGPPRHAHGGAISAVLDEAMGITTWVNGYPCLTANLSIQFLQPVKLEKDLLLDAWMDKIDGNKIWIHSVLDDSVGEKYASAGGLFVRQSKKRFEEMGDIQEAHFQMLKLLNDDE